jgi:uncharacterized membrane protein
MFSRTAPLSRPLLAALLLAAAIMTVLACVRWSIWSYGSDTGTFAQVILNVPHGFTNTIEQATHFKTHWSPILAVLWPLVALTRSPLSIQIAQILLIVLSVIPLYAIVGGYADDRWALRCAFLALIYPPLLANAFSEFHELAFYPVLALAMFWAADRARWSWFVVCSVALVLVREDVCIDLLVIGLALAIVGLARRNTARRGLLYGEPRQPLHLAAAGFMLALLSAGALALYALVVLPRAGPWWPSSFYRYPFADGPLQTALSVFTHPLQLLRAVATFGRLTYLLEAFVPLAFLPLRTRWSWLAFPAFAGILLANNADVWRMGMHYTLLWAPWILLAAAWALVRLAERSPGAAAVWWRTAIALCAIFLIAFNPMHPVHYLRAEPWQHTADATRAFECVPHNAPVATHDEWFAHEALAFPRATEFGALPAGFRGYFVFAADWHNFAQLAEIQARLARRELRSVCSYGTVSVLRST